MTDDAELDLLAELAGIEAGYWDIFGTRHETSRDAKRALLDAMGFDVTTGASVAEARRELEERDWRRALPPVQVVRRDGGGAPSVQLTLPAAAAGSTLRWRLHGEDGRVVQGEAPPDALPATDRRRLADGSAVRLRLDLPATVAEGYHRLAVEAGGCAADGTVAVAPDTAHRPDWMAAGGRGWGLQCHLYAVRAREDWGMGDFGTLGELVDATAALGGGSVGLNPLHALFAARPDHASPYSPSSRLFLNPLYIDATAEPEFADAPEVRDVAAGEGFVARLAHARAASHVDYPEVAALKWPVLEALHAAFRERHPPDGDSPRRRAFEAFRSGGGEALWRFAVFEALQEHFAGAPWHQWPEGFRRPEGTEVAAFARDHAVRVEFHAYLQWVADAQLAAAARRAEAAGMAVGLYRDLAVGADPDGADAWAEPDLTAVGARVGAPPDAFNQLGQDWGMPPVDPLRLRERAYRPFTAMLAANMRHAGALRIDHAMMLQHLYWIPPGGTARDGAYVRYPFEDLLGLLALESRRHRCVVIGEDLGTVPDGFRERMAAAGALSYRIFYFERHGDGLFKRPDAYPALALATPTTHDLATVAGNWQGRDIALRRELGLYRSAEERAGDEDARERDRRMLVAALSDQGLLPADFPVDSDDPARLAELIAAVHRFLARTPAALVMANLDDLMAETAQLNLPGTVSEYPNWRRRLSKAVEEIAADPLVTATVGAIRAER